MDVLGQVCDVYLELIKPVISDCTGSEESNGRRHAAQATLFTVLEQFLRYVIVIPST